ncbi:hypothetical protein [Streptomyces sp. NPDC048425]|uniref:hypothetical protein n=1 Tax=Streptomyces sp. NPDC048425 TaxID=3365548 RepID=UPI003719D8F0
MHRAASYERTIPLAADGEQDTKTDPDESAAAWHRQELGRWLPTPAMAGMLPLGPDYTQDPTPDEFALAVEEQLARYEVHILAASPRMS